MPTKIIWLAEAEDDLMATFSYLYPHNPSATLKYIDDVRNAVDRLIDFPLSGRQYDDRYRVIVVRNHLIFYRHDDVTNQVTIVRVLDGRRDIRSIL